MANKAITVEARKVKFGTGVDNTLYIKPREPLRCFAGVRTLAVTRLLLLQHRTISFKLLAKSVNCLFARSRPCTKACTKTSLSLYYTLCFRVKTIQLSPFHLQSTARCPPFYKMVCWLSAMISSDCL